MRCCPDPFRFDVTRTPNEHVGFGSPGPHHCLGANLARREMRVMFRAIHDRLPDLEITGPPECLRSNFIHGIQRMPCASKPRGSGRETRGRGAVLPETDHQSPPHRNRFPSAHPCP